MQATLECENDHGEHGDHRHGKAWPSTADEENEQQGEDRDGTGQHGRSHGCPERLRARQLVGERGLRLGDRVPGGYSPGVDGRAALGARVRQTGRGRGDEGSAQQNCGEARREAMTHG